VEVEVPQAVNILDFVTADFHPLQPLPGGQRPFGLPLGSCRPDQASSPEKAADRGIQKISEGSISLNEGYAKPLDGPREVGSGMLREEPIPLSRLIDIINERFGGELNEADQLFFDQIAEAASRNESLQKAAEVNSLDKFQLVFRQVLESLFIERMEMNEELFAD